MTREETIDNLARDIALKRWYEDNPDPFDKHRLIRACQEAAQKGAEWADEHPDEAKIDAKVADLVSVHLAEERAMWTEKARKWIENYLFEIGYPDDWVRDSKNMESGVRNEENYFDVEKVEKVLENLKNAKLL